MSNTEPALPITFTIQNGHDPVLSAKATIVKQIANPHISELPPDLFAQSKTVFLAPSVVSKLGDHHAFYMKIHYHELFRHALLLKIDGTDAYHVMETALALRVEDPVPEDSTILRQSTSQTIEAWRREQPEGTTNTKLFSMKPPAQAVSRPKPYQLSPQNETDPLDFLLSRYYNTLYSLTTPLSYFPKTALARFRNMCENNAATMKTHLLSIYLTAEQLEQRHATKFGLSPGQATSMVSGFERENQKQFLLKNLDDLLHEAKMEKLVLELKIREAQLQLLVLMELLLVWGINEQEFLEKNSAKQTKAAAKKLKPSLVRKRKSKNTMVPTLLGVAVTEKDTQETQVTDEYSLYLSLVSLVDHMGLWDTLLGRIKGEKDESMYGFLAYVLLPFFNKQLPQVVEFIIRSVKEQRPKLKVPKAKRSHSLSKSLSESATSSPADTSEPQTEADLGSEKDLTERVEPKRKSKFAKQLLSQDQIPFLRRAATTIDDTNELQPAFLMKRSKSSLGSKNLKRRQVDLTKPEPVEEEAKKLKLFLFGDARRMKSLVSMPAPVTLVEATPAKKSQSTSGLNRATKPTSSRKTDGEPQVFATPSIARTKNFQIEETPVQRNLFAVPDSHRKISVHEKIARLAKSSDEFAIPPTPTKDSEDNKIFLGSKYNIQSSPIERITSSPVSQRTKPGQQISLMDSPIFNSPFNGSPRALNVNAPTGSVFSRTRKVKKVEKATVKAPVKAANEKPKEIEKAAQEQPKEIEKASVTETKEQVQVTNNVPKLAAPANEEAFKKPPALKIITKTVKKKSTDFSHIPFSETDTDSDSDYEKLLASASKSTIKMYTKRK